MPFWPSCAAPASLNKVGTWRSHWLTVQAMVLLCFARLLIAFVPLRLWRRTLGQTCSDPCIQPDPNSAESARRIAVHVKRAASRLPFDTKCLPRAMVLAWMLQIQGISFTFKLAARPLQARNGKDDLHAWVEAGGTEILGWVAGPWIVVLTLSG